MRGFLVVLGVFVSVAAIVCGACSRGNSQSTSSVEPTVKKPIIVAALRNRFPNIDVLLVHSMRVGSLQEVVTTKGIVYTDSSGTLLIQGPVVDLKTGTDVTFKEWSRLHPVRFDRLPFTLAIQSVYGNGQRKLAIFADPECPFCRQLQRELRDLKDVSVYTFLDPMPELHPRANEIARRIWCAKDRGAAWDSWMIHNELPPTVAADCTTSGLNSLKTLAEQVGVQGTPTIVFENGRRKAGLMSVAALDAEISKD